MRNGKWWKRGGQWWKRAAFKELKCHEKTPLDRSFHEKYPISSEKNQLIIRDLLDYSKYDKLHEKEGDRIFQEQVENDASFLAQEVEQELICYGCFEKIVDELYAKRASTREKALLKLVDAFERSVLTEYLESIYFTVFTRCMISIDVGSTYESYLASRVIGLLAITIGYESNAYELMESMPCLSSELESGSDFKKLSVLDCLAVTTFFGATDVNKTFLGINAENYLEKAMGMIWEILSSTWTSKHGRVSSNLLAKAISAWSFLLSAIDGEKISLYKWKESFSVLCGFLEDDDCWLRIAAVEAIAVIFGTGEHFRFSKNDIELDEIRCKIRKIICKEYEVEKDVNHMQESFEKVLEFLETGTFHEVSITIPKKHLPLKISTYAQYIQLKFLKHFLGRTGFLRHSQGNTKVHDLFDSKEAVESIIDKKYNTEERFGPYTVEIADAYCYKRHRDKERRNQLRKMQGMWAQDGNHGFGEL